MALVLHLTDLHLGDKAGKAAFDDYKSDFVPLSERVSRQGLLISTLNSVAGNLNESKERLDALVVSGDITFGGATDGFEALNGVLQALGDQLPPPERIVVVPGNHDVKWRTDPSSPERYADFLKYTRARGYITPLLDGIDLASPPLGSPQHQLLLDSGNVQIVPLNSANYCGVVEPLAFLKEDEWKAICGGLRPEDSAALSNELQALRLYDAARFSPQQLGAVAAMLRSTPHNRAGRIRMAVLHHHLLPVSTREEVKPFESIVNLGALREFLLANEFDIVLHGHKHTGGTFWDTIASFQPADHHALRRLLVISGSTVGGSDSSRGEVCRLLRINTETTAPRITVSRVPAVDSGGRLRPPPGVSFALWDSTGVSQQPIDAPKIISGESLDGVYDRLLAYFEGRTLREVSNDLVCEIRTPPSDSTLPLNYPTIPGREGEARTEWLRQLVKWWQRPGTALDNAWGFTHGERIYRWNAKDQDQLKQVVGALQRKTDTSRAVITLVGPDDWASEREAPSFCSAQFLVVQDKKQLRLNCVAYFRKQEMRYWWPVNIAELVYLQRQALEKLRASIRDLKPGSITTFSAIALASDSIPKVAVPIVDRLLDEDRDTLWQLAYALVWPGYPQRDRVLSKWNELLDNLVPPAKPDHDGPPIAIRGLEELIEDVERFARVHTSGGIQQIRDALSMLLQTNKTYALETRTDVDQAKHDKWRADCERIVVGIRKSILEC